MHKNINQLSLNGNVLYTMHTKVYEGSRPLRIGYLENDGYTQPSPSFVRGLREVKAALEQAGHTVRQQDSQLNRSLMTYDCIAYTISML